MITRVLRGTTDQNNAYLGLEGEFTFDETKQILRVHDGETPGGFEFTTEQAFIPAFSGPGPVYLEKGTLEKGYYGEVSQSLVTDGLALLDQLEISSATTTTRNFSWFKFASKGKTLFIPSAPLFSTISAETIAQAGARYGERVITLNDVSFKVRMITGADTDPSNMTFNAINDPAAKDSELISLVGSMVSKSYNPFSLEWQTLSYPAISSGYELCQETYVSDTQDRIVVRQFNNQGILLRSDTTDFKRNDFWWRPVLEVITE